MAKYAVYSETQSHYTGTFFYKKADGSYVEVTEVNDDPTFPGNCWPDKVFLGEVTSDFVRGKDPEMEPKYKKQVYKNPLINNLDFYIKSNISSKKQ